MNKSEFIRRCNTLFRDLSPRSPIDTGNLRYNSMKIAFSNNGNECRIFVDEDIAPYMPYTNEPWISPKWHGKKNPNEKWFDNAAVAVIERFLAKINDDIIEVKET